MIRTLVFIALIFALGFGFAYLADMPGTVAITVGGQLITVSLMVAAIMVVAIVASIMIVWWMVRVLWTSPERMNRFFRARKRDRGYQSLSTGIIAAGAGDAAASRRMLKQAGGLLNETIEPLIGLLDAQTTLLEGRHGEARAKFEAMLDDPELRMLGMRGLYMEAQRLGDRDAQRHYAERAAELAPQLAWAGKAALDLKTASGDWDGAIKLVDKQKAAGQIAKDDGARKRAVLLTALAMELAEIEPAKAKLAGLEAHKLAPDFAPAAIVTAEAALRINEMRRAVKVLETTWRKAPHPDIALTYVNCRAGDSGLDRLKRARRLEALKPNNTESSLIVARMALEAGEFEAARKAAGIVLRNEPRETVFMLMADIEDAQTGDQGKVRQWLSRAVRAPRDPAWTADGIVSEKWAPFSPVTGRIDAFEWKVPVERLGPMIDNDLDPMQPGRMMQVPAAAADPAATAVPPLPEPDMAADRTIKDAPAKPVEPPRPVDKPVVLDTPDAERTRKREPAQHERVQTKKASPVVAGMNEANADIAVADAAEPAPGAVAATAPEAIPADAPEKGPQPVREEPAAKGRPTTVRPKIETETTAERTNGPAPAPQQAAPSETAPPDRTFQSDDNEGADEAGWRVNENPVRPPIPDDPGIDPDAAQDTKPGRFRLF